MNGTVLISTLKKKLRVSTDTALAKKFGVSIQTIQNWKNRRSWDTKNVSRLITQAMSAGATELQSTAIRPLVEFFPIEKSRSSKRVNWEVFSASDGNGADHPYRRGLKDELMKQHGVYIFFDTRGEAIYVGKARKQKLWREMNLAFNRDRGEVQKVKRVRHPRRKESYRTSNEKARQIKDFTVPLHELAAYFSAYEVATGMISDLEALLVRSFANNLLNVRMERFIRQRRRRER